MKKKIHSTDFYKNILTLMTGTALAQIVPILVTPILTRQYSPEEYGTYALFMSFVGICSSIATLRYELAIMLPESDSDSVRIIIISVGISFLLSSLLFIFITLFNYLIPIILRNNQIQVWLYYLPVMVFLIGIFQSIHYWISRNKKYRRLSMVQVARSGSKATMQIGLYYLLPSTGSTGLICGGIIGQMLATISITALSIRSLYCITKSNLFFTYDKFIVLLKKYKNFPLINAPHAFVNTLSASLPVILLTRFFSGEVAGFYSLSLMVVMLPSGLVSNAIGQVFFQKISEIYNRKECLYPYVLKLAQSLFLIAIIPFTVLFVTAPMLFSIVFGEQWATAGVYTQILVPWIFLRFIVAPISYVPLVLSLQGKAFFLETINILFVVSVLILGSFYNNIIIALILLSSLSLLILLYNFFWLLAVSRGISSKI